MGSILIYKGMPPLTGEQKARLKKLDEMPDEDINLDDIPELTDEQMSKMKRVPPERLYKKITLDIDIDDNLIQTAARKQLS